MGKQLRKIIFVCLTMILLIGCKSNSSSSSTNTGASSNQSDFDKLITIEGIRYREDNDGSFCIKILVTNNTDEYMSKLHLSGYTYDSNGKKLGNIAVDANDIPAHDTNGSAYFDAKDRFYKSDSDADDVAGIIFKEYMYWPESGGSTKDMRGNINLDYPISELELWQK